MAEALLPPGSRVIDFGCGDGRDAMLFAERGHYVTAVDVCPEALLLFDHPNIRKFFGDVEDLPVLHSETAVYARWLLHAAPEHVEDAVIRAARIMQGLLFIEARSDRGTDPGGHFRRLVCLERLVGKLSGFTVFYAAEKQGWSVEDGDDPLLLRVIAHG